MELELLSIAEIFHAFSRTRFQTMEEDDVPLMDEICSIEEEPHCVMHGPVLRQHQDEDPMS
ncbi:unnamed protein product [Albugo candida]|uniref:Uncharacterized protein n=1 Tax=Albugo candida TaxID=65357 RepID=A0A024FSZ1_9STRA|nr:unnamed protein product [Albugo candida]|eukprot:CCI10071.1 unnamed protein product [Albugo candida]